MRRDVMVGLAILAIVSGLYSGTVAAADADDPYYCPPGAKFCPAPGTAPVAAVALDTRFGLPARDGQTAAYRDADPMDDPFRVAAPGPASPRRDPASEVANRQAARPDSKREKTNGEKVSWWKGGLWRNRGRDDGDKRRKTASKSPSRAAGGRADAAGPGALSAADDMWGDEDFSGYNQDGSYAGGAAQSGGGAFGDPFSQPQFTTDPYAGQPQYASDPYSQPAAGYPGSEPYSQPYSTDPYTGQPQYAVQPSPGAVGDVYTLPSESVSAVSPYPPAYQPDSGYGAAASGPAPAYRSQEYVPPLNFDPASGGQSQAYGAAPNPDFLLPPPGSQSFAPPQGGRPAAAVSGGPAFQRAVAMVKESRFTEAKAALTGETQQNPSNSAAWRWLADCHYNLLELDSALAAYDRARSLDPNDYYAARGQGFAYLHRGHELWRRMQEEVAAGQKDRAAETFSQAHENYKKALELLGTCLRRAPNDGESIYGEAMAAEGASRKLYSNAISYLKLGPENRERAEVFAENCLTVINKGIDRARDRAKQNPGESGPRALLGGLYLRKAILYRQLGKNDLALIELKNAHDVQQSILDEIDKNNASAQKGVAECENYWRSWGGPSAGAARNA